MPRTARAAVGGVVYHVLNRGNGRMKIFREPGDYAAFVSLLIDARQRATMEVLGFCLMPNHWHLVLKPGGDRDLATYMSWLTNTHVKRYRSHYKQTSGHLYQGRFKSFAVENDPYLLTLLRYVEANPLRAGLVERAQQWKWSSLGCDRAIAEKLLDPWPVDRPANWTSLVNRPQDDATERQILTSLIRGRPLGGDKWCRRMAEKLGISYTMNPRGRPKLTQDK